MAKETFVKRNYFIIALGLILTVSGCKEKVKVDKESTEYQKNTITPAGVPLTESGTDRFNPQSEYESIRKKRLTYMGRIPLKPPVHTPDIASVNASVERPGMLNAVLNELNYSPLEKPAFPFDYENNVQKLRKIYKDFDLESIVNPDTTTIGTLVRLMVFTNEFLAGGTDPGDDWMTTTWPSVERIAALKREKNIGGRSAHYAAMFTQLCLACGYNSRIVGMHTIEGGNPTEPYFVSEVFLSNADSWVVFDSYARATYYINDHKLLSSLDLREIWIQGFYQDVEPRTVIGDFTDIAGVREKLFPQYKYLYTFRMNDILDKDTPSKPLPWQALFAVHLVWEDEYSPVSLGKFDTIRIFDGDANPEYRFDGVTYIAHDEKNFNWRINHIYMDITRPKDDMLRIYFDTNTPNFDHFYITALSVEEGIDSQYTTKKNIFEINQVYMDLWVSSVNVFGKMGVPAHFLLGLP